MATALVYGAYGYTGELIARAAREQGLEVLLAGRDAARTRDVAARHGWQHRVFGLDDPRALDAGLQGVGVVIHCAGPFSRTALPMVDACMRRGVHYLDITGEISIFEALFARDAQATNAGVMLLPGAGFDVVPSDCLAAHLARRLPGAGSLWLAFMGLGRVSQGTAKTIVENLDRGCVVRRDGRLVTVPTGSLTRVVDYGSLGKRPSMAIAWGDVSTAYRTTGIPNITVYVPAPRAALAVARLAGRFNSVLASARLKRFLAQRIEARPPGPTDAERERGKAFLWARVEDAHSGESAEAWLTTPETYTLTARTALEIARRVLAGEAQPGFRTPAQVFGPDFIVGFDGVKRTDGA
jgi:short subunit dehydrogenase-like uncharacterized protein